MRAAWLLAVRTLMRLLRSGTSLCALCGFVALASALFVYRLKGADGGVTPVAVVWALAAVPLLPVLAALLTMGLVAEDRARGLFDVIFSAPVRAREYVFGRFAGAFALVTLAVFLYAAVPLLILPRVAPGVRAALGPLDFLPGLLALLMQSVLWCAAGVLASACFRRAAAAATAALVLMLALPHAAFRVATAWSPLLRARLVEMPFDAHIADFATGLVSPATLAFYAVLAAFALFAATKKVAAARFCGRAGALARLSAAFAVALAFVFAVLAVALAVRFNRPDEWARGPSAVLSARTRQILAETQGDVRVTCLAPAGTPGYRELARILRGLQAAAEAVAGVRLKVRFVDPRWEPGEAVRLVRGGQPEGTVAFRRGARTLTVNLADIVPPATNGLVRVSNAGLFAGEALCASYLQRLALPARREVVYWTTGHGEASFASYDTLLGFSDIARAMRGDGYVLRTLDLAAAPAVPEDCAVLVLAAPRESLSRAEKARLDGWLRAGGRLLVLTAGGRRAGANALLADWGVRVLPFTAVSPRTLTGSDVLTPLGAAHKITAPLAGETALFAGAAPLVSTTAATAEGAAPADALSFVPLAATDAAAWGERDVAAKPWTRDAADEPAGPLVLAAALERGGRLDGNEAIRPVRIVVFSDPAFVSNGALGVRANANASLFLNALAWLAGLDAQTAARIPGDVVATGLARADWQRLALLGALAWPGCAGIVWFLALWVRRRRSA